LVQGTLTQRLIVDQVIDHLATKLLDDADVATKGFELVLQKDDALGAIKSDLLLPFTYGDRAVADSGHRSIRREDQFIDKGDADDDGDQRQNNADGDSDIA
jgi:hypothetical protein